LFYNPKMAPPFDAEARDELGRVIDGLRRAVNAAVSLDLSAAELSVLADEAQALARALDKGSGQKPFPRYGGPLDALHPNAILPFSPVTGPYNPLSPPVEIELVAGTPVRVVGRVTFGGPYEGPPSGVHGGVVASVYDELLALAAIANDAGGPTATLTVRYRRLTPLRTPLRFETWTDRIDGRKAFVRGACYAGDEMVSEAEGLFVRFDAARTPWAGDIELAKPDCGVGSEG
jgi:acyl-coenzyme A thioesterase PaaI-like protein